MSAPPLLEVDHLTIRFGGLVAVDDLSFSAQAGAITALIGPNGAGKTTVFNCLTGFYKPSVGRLRLNTEAGPYLLERMEDFRIARDARLARTFQNIRLFPAMSVLENLLVAQHQELMRASGYTLAGLFGAPAWRRAERADSLSYGDQRRLEIARAMCMRPRLLCLDEPAAGLNARESAALQALIDAIRREQGTGILLIEHDMSVVMGISDAIVVLDYGRKIAHGTPEAVRADPAVIRAYLGEAEDAALPPEIAADLSGVRPPG